jgi:hypothetical protein
MPCTDATFSREPSPVSARWLALAGSAETRERGIGRRRAGCAERIAELQSMGYAYLPP